MTERWRHRSPADEYADLLELAGDRLKLALQAVRSGRAPLRVAERANEALASLIALPWCDEVPRLAWAPAEFEPLVIPLVFTEL